MNHFATPDFWQHYNALPEAVRELADKNCRLLRNDPLHTSPHFKRVKLDVWSARVGCHYRALAFEEEDGCYWFRSGPHAQYDSILTHL